MTVLCHHPNDYLIIVLMTVLCHRPNDCLFYVIVLMAVLKSTGY